ncbi:MAG: SDR family oxidoreductase [Balneolia bacterium]|nr:SDR family oxidoreductase [Balneolia bacterium]
MAFFDKKTALVTGASSGIGRRMSLDLAARGCKPILVARRKDRLTELASEIKETTEIDAVVIEKDLNEPGAAAWLFSRLKEDGIDTDILINNAGFGFKGRFLKGDAATYRSMTDLNVSVLTELSYFFLPDMLSRKQGGILNVASMAAMAPVPYFAVYAATKSYVSSFGCALWHEMKGTGVHISTLCPGPVRTEFFKVAGAKEGDAPERTVQTAEEVSKIGLDALATNKMLVPTSNSLRILSKVSSVIPLKTNMKVAASFMKESDS